jgi:hypothetical protein
MLLPIVLLLASTGPTQEPTNVAVPAEQPAIREQNRGAIDDSGRNRFLPGKPRHYNSGDEGIIVQKNPCVADGTCRTGCLSLTAYVFSDGENPQLQYVTHCPNLDVPYHTERANHNVPHSAQQPDLKRTKN